MRHALFSRRRWPRPFGGPFSDPQRRLFPAEARRSDGRSSWSRHRLGDLGQAAESLAIPGEAFLQDHDPLEPALPFTNEQCPGLQCDALPSLWGAPVEGDAGAIVLLGSKVPPDRFVEIAESVRLESIGEHPH